MLKRKNNKIRPNKNYSPSYDCWRETENAKFDFRIF